MPGARCAHGPCAKWLHTVVTAGHREQPGIPAREWF
jgi:hypothetical protein